MFFFRSWRATCFAPSWKKPQRLHRLLCFWAWSLSGRRLFPACERSDRRTGTGQNSRGRFVAFAFLFSGISHVMPVCRGYPRPAPFPDRTWMALDSGLARIQCHDGGPTIQTDGGEPSVWRAYRISREASESPGENQYDWDSSTQHGGQRAVPSAPSNGIESLRPIREYQKHF